MAQIRWSRLLGATAAAYVVAVGSLTLLFGNPLAERILFTDDGGQAGKVLAVWFEHEPLPAVTPFWDQLGDLEGRGFAVQGMLFLWALALVVFYALGWVNRPGSEWRKGASFGITVWAVLFLFFEAYIPFNLFGEPFHLVLLELTLQLIAMVLTGLTIAGVYRPELSGTDGSLSLSSDAEA